MCDCDDASSKFNSTFIRSNLIAAIVAALLGGDGKMTTDLHTLVLIVLCGVVTLLVRVIPFIMISRVNLPAIVIKWLFLFLSLYLQLLL